MLIFTHSLTANLLASHSLYAHKDASHLQCWHSLIGFAICNSFMKSELHQATHELDQGENYIKQDQEENSGVCHLFWFKVWLISQKFHPFSTI